MKKYEYVTVETSGAFDRVIKGHRAFHELWGDGSMPWSRTDDLRGKEKVNIVIRNGQENT